jgi:hypothetical protein
MREVTSLVDILFSFTSTVAFPFYLLGGFVKESVLSADLISLHLDALFGGEDYFPHACLHEGFAISIGIPPPDKAIISYLHQGLSQALVFNFLISKLVDPFASSLCLWEGYGLHFVSHFIKTMLMLNAHPYTSLLKCFAMTHTHHFG